MSLNRILLIIILIVATINFVFSLSFLRGSSNQNKEINSKLENLDLLLNILSKTSTEDSKSLDQSIKEATSPATLGIEKEVEAPKSIGYITINDEKTTDVNIYEERSYSSKVVAKASFGKAYRYMEEEGGWFLIALPGEEKTGWVSGRFFKEIDEESL